MGDVLLSDELNVQPPSHASNARNKLHHAKSDGLTRAAPLRPADSQNNEEALRHMLQQEYFETQQKLQQAIMNSNK